MGSIGFLSGAAMIVTVKEHFPRRVLLQPDDGLLLGAVVLLVCLDRVVQARHAAQRYRRHRHAPRAGHMSLDREAVFAERWLRSDLRRLRIIFTDEPTAALDSQRARIVMDLLRKVTHEQQAAILVVTHDEKVFDHFDHMFHLQDGQLGVG